MKRRVFVDMDGVLCELNSATNVSEMLKDGYFRNLRPRTSMVDAVRFLLKSGAAEVYVLSSVLAERPAECTREKNEWLDYYLPEINASHRIFPVCGTSKASAVNGLQETDVLCDDYSVNLSDWVKAGGKGIKIMNEINGRNGKFQAGPRLELLKAEDLFLAVSGM